MDEEEQRSTKRAKVVEAGPPNSGFMVAHEEGDKLKVPGLVVCNHNVTVPLDYSNPSKGVINIFVRELASPVNANRRNMPYLLYLQGGPGMESPRPTEASMWIKSAVNNFRVILMDQRGTGRSSPITVNNLAKTGDAQLQADYLAHFRADNIVRDAECVRKVLVPKDQLGGRWSILGQSFGGFCAVTYLSQASEGLLEVMMTGGMPPGVTQACAADDVYMACHKRVLAQNKKYYARFPQDVQLVQRIVRYLESQPDGGALLPSGTRLTPRAFQTLGLNGLGSGGGFERLHFLLECFFDQYGEMSPAFAKSFEMWQSWDTNPLYALLHEAIYCQGAASNWAAHRIRQKHFAAEFDAVGLANAGQPVNFTGEMVYPWMFEDFAALRPYKAAADILAAKSDWGLLYNQLALVTNNTPVAAVSYVEDMYVDYTLATETANLIKGVKHWVTNEYRHSGIRDDGARIFDRLLGMVRESVFD